MLTCENDVHYFASPDFLTFALHTLTCISLPTHALGFYCILYKTPTIMNSVKLPMIVLSSLCFSLDIVITLLGVPYAMFPAMAGFGIGLIDSPGLYLYLMVTIITATTTSVTVMFENRFFVLFAEQSWWRHVRKTVIFVNYLINVTYFLPAQFLIPEQDAARKIVWESLGCQPILPEHRQLFVLSTDFTVPAYSILTGSTIVTSQNMLLLMLNIYYLTCAKPESKLSAKTIKLQRKLAFALLVQSVAIMDLAAFPIIGVIYSIRAWYHSQVLNNVIFIALSAHGTASTLVMLFAHKPYRDFVLSPLRQMMYRAPVILVTSKRESGTAIE